MLWWVGTNISAHVAPSALHAAHAGLLELCKQCGSEAVSYLSALQDPGMVESADCSLVTACLGQISAIGQVCGPGGLVGWDQAVASTTRVPAWSLSSHPMSQELRPRGLDIKQEELGDLVDKEMAATAAAIETASARIEVRVTVSREVPTGTMLGACSDHCRGQRGTWGSVQPLSLQPGDAEQGTGW